MRTARTLSSLLAVGLLGLAALAGEAATRVDARDGPLAVALAVEPADPAIGEEVRVSLRAELEEGLHVEWPDLATAVRDALGEEVVEVRDVRRRPDGRGLDARLRLFDTGTFALPPLRVRAWSAGPRAGDAALADLEIAGVSFYVAAPDGLSATAAPGRGPRAWGEESGDAWWGIAGLCALALLAALGAVVWARRRFAPPPAPPAPPPPPHERALSALRALLAQRLPEHGDVDAYFVGLTGILRHYVEERFGLRAPEQTTEEFLAEVAGTDAGRRAIDAAQRDVLRDVLTAADLVKFAQDEPDLSACAAAAAHAERFVAATASPDEEPES